ncbi:MAG TPA: hypothetical protein VIV60_09055, partial [Polyangiaceae bacterium]
RSGSSCTFQHECNTDADCVAASNASHCCACSEWVPRQLLSLDTCYTPTGQGVSSSCESCKDVLPCDGCPAPPTGTCRADGTGWRKCL